MPPTIVNKIRMRAQRLREDLGVRCPMCGATHVQRERHEFKNEGKYAHRVFDSLRLSECSSCRSSWVSSPPTSAELAEYYGKPGNYQPSRMEPLEEDRWPIWDSRPASLITLGRMFVEFSPGERFVDVGPGNGAALSLAPLLLPQPELGCIEYSTRTIEFLERHVPGISVASSIDELMELWGEESVAMLYSAHCFEHFSSTDLSDSLDRFHRALRPGGACVVEVPFAPPSRVAATSKHTPHLIYFTPDGLRSMLTDHGFEVQMCAVCPGSTPNSTRWFKQTFPAPDPAVVGKRFASYVTALNSKDFVSRDPDALEQRGASGVIKCIAVKRSDRQESGRAPATLSQRVSRTVSRASAASRRVRS